MKLSSLQKYILKQCLLARDKIISKSVLERFYNNLSRKPKEVIKIITKSVERLIKKELVIGYGWKNLRRQRSFDMLVLLGTFILPMLAPFPVKALGWNPLDYIFTWPGWNWPARRTGGTRSNTTGGARSPPRGSRRRPWTGRSAPGTPGDTCGSGAASPGSPG